MMQTRAPAARNAAAEARPMPAPDDPAVLSPSRAILKINNRYYAVELGQTLAQKRVLEPEHLPDALRADEAAADSAETRAAEAG